MKIKLLTNYNYGATVEGAAAEKLKDILLKSIPNDIIGQITIAPNVTLPAQPVRDIDLAVWGNLSNCVLPYFYKDETAESPKDLQVNDFFLVIELKGHPADKVYCQDSHLFAKYADEGKDATVQNENQRLSMLHYLKINDINISVSNALWFNSIDKDELFKITSNRNLGALPSVFTFKDLITTIIGQGQKPTCDLFNDRYVLSAGIDSEKINAYILKLFK